MKTKTEKNQTNHPKAVSREESLAERLELLAIATTAGPAPAGDVVATVLHGQQREQHLRRAVAATVARVRQAFGAARVPGVARLLRFRQHHAPAASRRRVALPQR